MVRWMRFQAESSLDEWFKNPLEQINRAHQIAVQCSKATLSKFPMIVDYNLDCKNSTLCKRVDNFWSKIGSLTDEHGNLKYPKLYALVQAILSLSHGNAYPEQGFLINKQLLQSHGYVVKEIHCFDSTS